MASMLRIQPCFCALLLKANVVNQRLYPELVVLFSPFILFCFPSFSPFLLSLLITVSPYLQSIIRLLLKVKFCFTSCLFSPVYYYFFFLLALPKELTWKYHILTGKKTLLADLFTTTSFFLKQSSREGISVFQKRKRMSCSIAMKDNELSLSLTVKP